jgi:hypothetical protein
MINILSHFAAGCYSGRKEMLDELGMTWNDFNPYFESATKRGRRTTKSE